MTKVIILGETGAAAAKADVASELVAQEIKSHLIHETVVAELAARRAGTHSTKTRGKARGGGSKPWRQKGTGRARAGSIRSPLWTGGGIAFGPTPRSYGGKVNRKVRRQAFLGTLRAHVERGTIAVMDPTGWTEPSTKRAAAYLRAAPERIGERPLLVCLDDVDGIDARSFRNLAGVDLIPAAVLETADLLSYRAVLIERGAWERLTGELGSSKKVTAKDATRTAGEVEDERWAAGAPERAARAESQAEYSATRRAEKAEEAAAAPAEPTPAAESAPLAGTEPIEDVDDEPPEAGEDPPAAAADEPEVTAEATVEAEDDEEPVISDEELEAEALAAGEAEDVAEDPDFAEDDADADAEDEEESS